MLQASEYNIGDFFRWHERVKDFRSVEKRKQLVFSAKATALLVFGWAVLLFTLVAAVSVLLFMPSPWNYVLSALLLLEAPLIVMVGLLLAVAGVRVIQGPFEGFVVARARKRLAAHRGVEDQLGQVVARIAQSIPGFFELEAVTFDVTLGECFLDAMEILCRRAAGSGNGRVIDD